MPAEGQKRCDSCDAILSKDEIGASKKFLGRNTLELYCYNCLADYMDCTVEEIQDRVREFKNEGCALFS